jgi:hypothetical protein
MTVVNDNSRVANKLEASLTDDARVVIYDCQMLYYKPLGSIKNLDKRSSSFWFSLSGREKKKFYDTDTRRTMYTVILSGCQIRFLRRIHTCDVLPAKTQAIATVQDLTLAKYRL